jgi:hypothetical protein
MTSSFWSRFELGAFYIILEEDLTMLPHGPHQKSGEYLFHSFFLNFYIFYVNIGDNVRFKCKGVNERALENAITLDFCFVQW